MTPSQTAHPTEGELLPCPFCGETDFAMGDVEDTAYFASCSSGGHAVNCPSCGTIGPSGTTAHEAITAWNTRPDVRPQGEEGLWRPISEAPRDGTVVLLADYNAMDLLCCEPHVYAGRWLVDEWCGISYGATNENGEPTHWASMPEPNDDAIDTTLAPFRQDLSNQGEPSS